MDVSDIRIESLSAGGFNGDVESVYHKKILSTLSIVQAVRGNYEIKVDNGERFSTGEGGVFVAPANVVQEITHHNGENKVMQAHWVFIDAIVNREYRFDEIFSFPTVLDRKYNAEIYRIILEIRYPKSYFDKIKAAYTLLEILAKEGKERSPSDPVKSKIEKFVKEHYAETLKAKDIAAYLYCSVPQVFRYTKKYYGLSPANYINGIRLQQAEIRLLHSTKSVTEIAFSVGFSDSAYFSKLFKKHYGDDPSRYRRKYAQTK